MTDQLLGLLSTYGLPALFVILTVASVGIPLPVTLVLIVSGSFVAQGEMGLWQVLLICSAGAIAGDQLGYCLGRWGGRNLVLRVTNRFGGADMLKRAEEFTKQRGGLGIFLSRWLVTPLGPWLNLTSGIARYPWPHFLFWDVLGEVLWVVIYVGLGRVFSDRVAALADILGNLTWAILGICVAGVLGWKLFQYFRGSDESTENREGNPDVYSTAIEG